MNKLHKTTLRLALSPLLCAALAPAAPASSRLLEREDAGSSLVRAHASYLQKDYPAMVAAVKETMRDPAADDLVRANASKLLTAAFRDGCGHLPAGWRAPAGVRWLTFTETHVRQADGDRYKFELWLNEPSEAFISQVQIVRYPDHVVLDKRAGVGEFDVVPRGDGSFGLSMVAAENGRTPPPDGLYLLNLETDAGERTAGWFIVSDLLSSETPVLRSPAQGEHFADGHVPFVWDDFRSPGYDACERRTVRVNAGKVLTQAPYWERAWGFSEVDPSHTAMTIGAAPDEKLPDGLAPGSYWASLTYEESRQFGDLTLVRASRVGRPIYVDPAAK